MKSDLAKNKAIQFKQATEYPQPYPTEHVLIMILITLKGFYIQKHIKALMTLVMIQGRAQRSSSTYTKFPNMCNVAPSYDFIRWQMEASEVYAS